MPNDTTIDAVRLALGLQELRARVASINVANAATPSAQALRVDFASVQGALSASADDGRIAEALDSLDALAPQATGEAIQLDEQVTEMASASASYQTLTEALSRQFGLMRLALTGRS
jgi:flagellar basal body rod protein FlgB